MRNRFRPNVTPRGSRRAGPSTTNTTSSSSSSTSTSLSEPVQPPNEEEPAVFIPPNSCRAEVNVETTELDSSLIENVVTANILQEVTNSTPKVTTVETTSCTRRSRIKPSVTPASRSRNKPASRGSKTTSQDTNETSLSTTEIDTVTVDEVVSTTSTTPARKRVETSPLKDKNTNNITPEQHNKTTPKKSTSQPVTQPETPNETSKQSASSVEATEGNPPTTGSLLTRRKRAIPNIGAAARRRPSLSVPRDVTSDKGTSLVESSVNQQVEETTDKRNTSENDETGERSNKRTQSTAPEVLDDNIGVIEVTVQSDTPQIQTVEEEIPEEEVEDEQSNKKVEERKRKISRHSRPKEPLDPSKMTLQDLIYFNPKDNPMKSSVAAKRRRIEVRRKSSRITESENGDASIAEVDGQSGQDSTDQPSTATDQSTSHSLSTDTPAHQSEDEERVCAPQVKIGVDGNIILDEESLVIHSSPNSTLKESDIVYEDSNNLNYAAYFKQTRRTKWSMQETLKFYKALSQVGTDFSLMLPLFPKRKRRELKAKFKREEKVHRDLVDRALVHRTPITVEMFARHEETEEDVLNEITSVAASVYRKHQHGMASSQDYV